MKKSRDWEAQVGSWVGPWEETRKEQVVTGPWKDRVGWGTWMAPQRFGPYRDRMRNGTCTLYKE